MNHTSKYLPYCVDYLSNKRLPTHEVMIGDIGLGGKNPIRVQSMAVSDTMNTKAVIEESIRMIEAGCEYIRLTAPSKNEAENLLIIKKELRRLGYLTPLIADIHFTPNAAEIAARIVEKVRINPGNFADKKKFEFVDYSENEYRNELERIYHRFSPLIKICKEYGTALRIGVNHGSLSDRIMSRYGDTPLGMVQSAFEFIEIAEDLNFDQIVISMKASNPLVMVAAYRLLAARMIERNKNIYPIHLGVTEAGDGEDGRIKSALGIGALLSEGIGDTIRVSLTEPAENEMPVAKSIIDHFSFQTQDLISTDNIPLNFIQDPYNPGRMHSEAIQNIGGKNVPRVFSDLSKKKISVEELLDIGYHFSTRLDKWNMSDLGSDYVYLGKNQSPFMLPSGLKAIYDAEFWYNNDDQINSFPYFKNWEQFLNAPKKSDILQFVAIEQKDIPSIITEIKKGSVFVAIINSHVTQDFHSIRDLILELKLTNVQLPIVLSIGLLANNFERSVGETDLSKKVKAEDFFSVASTLAIQLGCHLSTLLIDGMLDGIWIQNQGGGNNPEQLNKLAFNLLQGVRQRISKTEYISCPSCGRTLFDLQETTAMIRKQTDHLKGVKIAVMGCIVNGPGEMADADFGYVGAGPGTISLYKGKEMVEKSVSSEVAVEKLIALIKKEGQWIEPDSVHS